jgi:26S proteasome regulatory subunit N5
LLQNVRVLARYYERITTQRMAEVLELTEEVCCAGACGTGLPAADLSPRWARQDAESHLSNLVSNGTVAAKIDRPARVIVFQPKRKPTAILNEWGTSIRCSGRATGVRRNPACPTMRLDGVLGLQRAHDLR